MNKVLQSTFGRNVLAEGLSERRKSDGSITIKIQVRLPRQKYQAEEEQDELYVNAPSECGREGVEEAGNSSLFKGRPAEGMPKRSQICCVYQPQQRPPCLTRFARP